MSALRVSTPGHAVQLVDLGEWRPWREWHPWWHQGCHPLGPMPKEDVFVGGHLVTAPSERKHQRPDQEVQR